jgi:polyisoprenoid-binding protein YceI
MATWVTLGLATMWVWSAGEPDSMPPTQIERLQLDPQASRVDFDITALWVLKRRGRFDQIRGTMEIDHARHQARIDIEIPVASVWMKDADHRELLLSPAFFDADAHPLIRFVSDPFPSRAGKERQVSGMLSLRGLALPTEFIVRADGCVLEEHPQDCHVHVDGVLQRSRFGMVEYSRTLSDAVRLQIQIVLAPPPP